MADKVYIDNDEATEAWNGVLFDRFVEYRDVVVAALDAFGREAMSGFPPNAGDRVLDVGCGFGDSTRQLAELVGPGGAAVGIDVAERFVEAARDEAERAGATNVEFVAGDAQAHLPDGPFDYVFSRMGTMFFANPGAAMRNIRAAMSPGGRLCMVVWRQKIDNEWFFRTEQIVDEFVDRSDDDETDEPTCGPGPFSMANADTTTGILRGAGFDRVALRRCDMTMKFGDDTQHAIDFALAIGPAAETVRLAGDRAADVRERIEQGIRRLAAAYERPDGIFAPASVWICTAENPVQAGGAA